MNKKIKYQPAESSECRLDMFLLEEFKKDPQYCGLSRSQIKNLIESGRVFVNKKPVLKAGFNLKPGAVLDIEAKNLTPAQPKLWEKEIPVVYEDKQLIVINKPAGISMHPGAGNSSETIVNALASHFSSDLLQRDIRAGVVHRLDKDTTGIVVLAKNAKTHQALSRLFAEREISKTYYALVMSTPRSKRIINRQEHGVIETLIGRDPKNRIRMGVSSGSGKQALTSWKIIERMSYSCLLEIDLKTGRTHQIRVHFNHINSPVIGDKTYGDFSALPLKLKKAAEQFGRQALHAERLVFKHPDSGKIMDLKAPLPADMEELINEFRQFRA